MELATQLTQAGVQVAVIDRAIDDELRQRFAAAVRADVTDAADVAGAVRSAVEQLGPPDLVVNSAGISRNDLFAEASAEDFERTIRVNLIGSRNLASAALPHLRPGAQLALIASLAGITGGYTYAAYASSKAGVIGLARVLRLEYAPLGIGVSVICPSEIMTPMVERYATTMHPVTRALKDIAGTLPIQPACSEMLDQLAAGRFTVIPGRRARWSARAARVLPERWSQALTDRVVRRTLAEVSTDPG